MKGNEFIKMMYQDIETHKDKAALSSVVQVMEAVVSLHPFADIEPSGKTPEDCYKKMYEYASNHKKGNSYCFDTNASMKFVSEYLGLQTSGQSKAITAPGAKIISLEEFL